MGTLIEETREPAGRNRPCVDAQKEGWRSQVMRHFYARFFGSTVSFWITATCSFEAFRIALGKRRKSCTWELLLLLSRQFFAARPPSATSRDQRIRESVPRLYAISPPRESRERGKRRERGEGQGLDLGRDQEKLMGEGQLEVACASSSYRGHGSREGAAVGHCSTEAFVARGSRLVLCAVGRCDQDNCWKLVYCFVHRIPFGAV